MENITPEPAHTILCKACSASVAAEDTFCTNCGYPLQGAEDEQKHFIWARDEKMFDFSEATRKIKRASVTLSFGTTKKEALANLQEALDLYFED